MTWLIQMVCAKKQCFTDCMLGPEVSGVSHVSSSTNLSTGLEQRISIILLQAWPLLFELDELVCPGSWQSTLPKICCIIISQSRNQRTPIGSTGRWLWECLGLQRYGCLLH